jgi:predicted dehydrogenase
MVRLTEQKQVLRATSKSSDVVSVAVIGCGYWGPNLVRNFFEAPASTVSAVCDLDQERLTGIAKRYPTIALTTDYRDILRDPDIDAVAIATPVSTHYRLAKEALEAGKNVWVEKPLTSRYTEAQRLTELAEQKNLVLMVDHVFVYTGAVQRIRQSIEAAELGEMLYYDSVRVNLGLLQHDVNVIWDLGVHDFSIVDYLLPQRPTAVSAVGARHINGGSESIAYVTLHFEENLIAHFHLNWLAPVKIRLTTVCGSRRMVVYDDTEPSEKVRIYDRGVTVNGSLEDRTRLLVEYRSGDMYAPKLEQAEALQAAARHFADCIVNGSRPRTDGEVGSRIVALTEAAQRSLTSGGRLEKVAR